MRIGIEVKSNTTNGKSADQHTEKRNPAVDLHISELQQTKKIQTCMSLYQ